VFDSTSKFAANLAANVRAITPILIELGELPVDE